MSINEKDSAVDCLFLGHEAKLVNIKFFRGTGDLVTADDICREMRSAVMQKRMKTATVSAEAPRSRHPIVDVAEFAATL